MPPIPAESLPHMSVEEYLNHEQQSEIRHELVNGYLYAMTGASDRHEEIAGNLFAALHAHLRSTPCRVYSSNLKIRVENNFYYPDIFVRCQPSRGDPYFKTDPVLIVEVLSPTTQRYDRGDKRLAYQQLTTLQEYVVISQDEIKVEVYRRKNNWQTEILKTTDQLQLQSVDFICPVQQLYVAVSE